MPDPISVDVGAVVVPGYIEPGLFDGKTVPEIVGLFLERVEELEWFNEDVSREDIELLSAEIAKAIKERPDASDGLTGLLKRLQAILTKRANVQKTQEDERRLQVFLAKLAQYERLIAAYEKLQMDEILPVDVRGIIDALAAMRREGPDPESIFASILLTKRAKELLARVEESRGLVLPFGALGLVPTGPSFVPTEDLFGLGESWATPLDVGPLQPPSVEPLTVGAGTPCIILYAGNPAAIAACEAARKQGLKICDPFSVGDPFSAGNALGDCASFGEIASPDNIAQSIQAQAEAAMAADVAGLPSVAMVANPTKAQGETWSVVNPELVASDPTYRRIFKAYEYPENADWKRLTQYYNDLQDRLDDEGRRVEGGAEPLTADATKLVEDLQAQAMSALTSGLIPYAILEEAELEARAVVRRIYGSIAEVGNGPTTNEERIVLADAISDCVAGIDCGKVPQQFLAVVSNEKFALEAVVGGAAFRSAIGGGVLEDVIDYWSRQGRRFSTSEKEGIRTQLMQQLTLAIRDESRRPVSMPDYSAYAPESLNRDEARLLVEAMRQNVNGQVDAFIESGTLCAEAGPLYDKGPQGMSEVAVGMDAVRGKYAPQGFELFGVRGFLPTFFHSTALKLKANAARSASLQEVDGLERYIESITGITPEELAKEVTSRIAVINRDTCEMLYRAAESCITIQAVWDTFFAYCNEIQAINQVVYLGMFKGVQAAATAAVRAAFSRTAAAGQQMTEFWYARSTSKMADDIRYGNYQEFKTHLVIQQSAASSITRYQNGVGPWAGKGYVGKGAFPKGMAQSTIDEQGRFVNSWVPEANQWLYRQVNPYTGAMITSQAEMEAVAMRMYREGRLAINLDPNQVWPVRRVGIFSNPEEAAISQDLFGASQAPAPPLLGAGGVSGFMFGLGPAGALLGLGTMAIESATQAVMDRINPKITQIPIAEYSAEIQPIIDGLLAQAKAQIDAGEPMTVDFETPLVAFYTEHGEIKGAELAAAEMEALTSDPAWGAKLGAQESSAPISIAERLGSLVGQASAMIRDPEAYENAATQLHMILGEIRLLEGDPDVTPSLLAMIQDSYTWVEQNAQSLLMIEQGTLGGQ